MRSAGEMKQSYYLDQMWHFARKWAEPLIVGNSEPGEKLLGKVKRGGLNYSRQQRSFFQGWRSLSMKRKEYRSETGHKRVTKSCPWSNYWLCWDKTTLPQVNHEQIKIHLLPALWLTKEQLYDWTETRADKDSFPGCQAKNGPNSVILEDVESHNLSIKVTAETFAPASVSK